MFGMHHKKALFLCCLRSLLVTYMIILSLEKEVIVLEKNLEKVLNFGYKNLYEPCNLILFLCQMCWVKEKEKRLLPATSSGNTDLLSLQVLYTV